MEFAKMHGIGNDFVLIDGNECDPEKMGELTVKLSDRHFGVGCDGVIFIVESSRADFGMRIFNPDGTEAMMCGNGLRCACKFVADRRMLKCGGVLRVDTLSGVRDAYIEYDDGDRACVLVDMGPALFGESVEFDIDGESVKGMEVSVGNPHLVILIEQLDDIKLMECAEKIASSVRYKGDINIEFVQIVSVKKIRVRVWERGCGETLACGSGACAAFAAMEYLGNVEATAEVFLPGGRLDLHKTKTGNIHMKGEAAIVFEGRVRV